VIFTSECIESVLRLPIHPVRKVGWIQ